MIIQPDRNRSIESARAALATLPKQVRFAASVGINTALGAGLKAERARMKQVFERPTPYVVRGGVAITNSTRDNLVGALSLATESTAAGNLPPGKPLRAEVKGGGRRFKRSEWLLQRGGVLPSGWYTVPGRGARLDAYGNVSRSQILEILAWFKTFTVRQSKSGPRNAWRDNITDRGMARKRAGTRNRAGVEYFAVAPGAKGGLKPGIYRRQLAGARFVGPVGPRPQLVLAFVPRTHYEVRLDFVAQAEAAVVAAFPAAYRRALVQALETAR